MFNIREQESVRAAFALCGFAGDLRTLPLESGAEVCFILEGEDFYELIAAIGSTQTTADRFTARAGLPRVHATVGSATGPALWT